jgi:acyl-CoA reductase-like NAD-dependent aldehyde dehydrogenase
MLTVSLQINGETITSKSIDITSPSTGKVIHKASAAIVTEPVKAAEAAEANFTSWADMPADQKKNIFLKAADILKRITEEVGKWKKEEAGATTFYASGFDVPSTVSGSRDVAGKISVLLGRCLTCLILNGVV